MTEKPTGVYGKLSREALVLMAGAYFALDFLGRAGFVGAAPVTPTLEPAIMQQFRETRDSVIANQHLLNDLHTGAAPRDANMTPQWAAMRQSLDRLTGEMSSLRRAVEGSTSATRGLTYELEGGEPSGAEAARLHQEVHRRSWLQRLSEWFWWDAAG